MGTTRDAFTADDGIEICFCLLIEGYDQILTSYADTSAVVDAYTVTEWNTAVAGLHVPEGITERMELFTGALDAPGARFVVSPDAADTFGKDVHKTADTSGVKGYLSSSITNKTDPIPVDDITGFPSSGNIYIGTECITYNGTSGTDIGTTTCYRGMYAPFKAYDEVEQRFGRPHEVTTIDGVDRKPLVTTYPRTWVGKVVRCLAHRVVGGVLDTFANAETIFAGTLEHIGDSESGNTILDCVHINQLISNRVLLADQYRGTVRPGLFMSAGDGSDTDTAMSITVWDALASDYDGTFAKATLTAVSGAEADETEITEGWYEYDRLLDRLNKLTLASYDSGTGLNSRIVFDRVMTEHGTRTRIYADGYTAGAADLLSVDLAGHTRIMTFLGITQSGRFDRFQSTTASTTPTVTGYGESTPLRSIAFQSARTGTESVEDKSLPYTRLEVVNPSGTWVTVSTENLPEAFNFSSGDWGYLQVGDVLISGKYDSVNERFTNLEIPDEQVSAFLGIGNKAKTAQDLDFYGTSSVDDSADVEIRQTVVLQNELYWLFSQIFYSTGSVADYNSIQFDLLPTQISLGLPFEMLGGSGDNVALEFALASLQAVSESGDLTVILDKPTAFGEILKPELLLRGATLVMDNGKLKVATFRTPGKTPDHTLTTATKATDANAVDPNRTRSNRTSRLLRDKITVRYNRTLDEKYRSSVTVVNLATLSDHGGYAKPITIKARNTIGGEKAQGAIIDSQITELASYALGMFGDEVTEVTRTISRKLFHVMPGDTVALTDDSVRNPLTGVRGVTSYPCWVEEVTKDWATGIGEVKLIMIGLQDSARYGIYSPAGQLSAYNTGTGVATLLPNAFTLAGDSTDDVDHFAVGDKVRFIEVSPSDPSSPSTWVDEIDSISGNDVTTVDNNGSGTYDSSLTYVMVSDDYSTAASAQQTDAYLADDADGRVQNSVDGFLWAREEFIVSQIFGINTGALYLEDGWLKLDDADQTGMDDFDACTLELELYIEELSASGEPDLFAKWGGSAAEKAWRFSLQRPATNTLRLHTSGTGGDDIVSGSVVWQYNRWYHLAATFDSGTVKLYVDGNEIANTVAATTHIKASTGDVHIGESDGIAAFKGYIDNVRFWNHARTEQEIRDNRYREYQGNESGLLCYVPFNEDYTDRTSNEHDFVEQAAASISTNVPWVLGDDPHRYPANLADDEGEPVSPHLHANAIRTMNNLISYKTAPQCSWWVGDTESSNWEYQYTSAGSDDWQMISVFPFALGAGRAAAGNRFTRSMVVAPAIYRASGSGTVSCRVTFSRDKPQGSTFTDVVFREPYQQLTFTTTSTSLEIATPQSVIPPAAFWPGTTYCTVEMKAVNTEVGVFAGFPIFYLGPLKP